MNRTLRLACFSALAAILGAGPAFGDPVARWGFGSEETSRLTEHGGVHRDLPGPRPPIFPDFDPGNLAVKFDGAGSHFSYADPGDNSPFDFTNGDSITLEAWVSVSELKKSENAYIIGKGRTGDPGFARDNQNWALRLRESGGEARPSFLFATPRGKDTNAAKDAHWHRWTTTSGFAPGSGWHHVAVAYRFGDPESVRGWVDGKPVKGVWDMGGPTREAPVVDNDAIWIGSAQGGAAANSYRGYLDEVQIHREVLSDAVMHGRFRREGAETNAPPIAETAPKLLEIPAGKVRFTFLEGLAAHDHWQRQGEAAPTEVAEWDSAEFILPRLPVRYDDWGIRQGWKPPVLVRAATDLKLPPGKQKFLMRVRGLSRLWVNGEIVVRTPMAKPASDGHEPVQPVPTPPLPGLRPVGFGDQEAVGEATIPADGKCRIILETIVGGKKYRAEPGEMCVAVLSPTTGSYAVIRATDEPLKTHALTDAGWEKAVAEAETSLARLDEQTRHKDAASEDAFWEKRHKIAREWAEKHSSTAVPAAKGELAAGGNAVDAFIAAKVNAALAASAAAGSEETKLFHGKVLPILSENCFRCHGEKEKGDLRLNTREAALKSGASGKTAVIPGDISKSELIRRIKSDDADERMPPKGDGLNKEQIAAIEQWVKSGAKWPAAPVSKAEVAAAPVLDDAAFLRRVSLDTIGVPLAEAEAQAFLADQSSDKRAKLVDRLLADPRFADHWMSYWQDVLAENPNMLKPSLNNSGPFRWFLFEALRDNKPMDRLVTELLMLRGSKYEGGSAGFGMAADNDAPLAAKGQVLAGAFLGVEMQCARCHDAPFHSTKQRELYALAAMLDRKETTIPKSSTVPPAFFEKKARESLIKVTVKPGEKIQPTWPFEKLCGVADDASIDALLHDPKDTRERLAALVTSPQNGRFARVLANRVWKRLIGAGIVEPAHDWEGHAASHPELLDYLATELVRSGYDFKAVVRLVLTSQLYQREAVGKNLAAGPDRRFFTAPDRRRLSGEQVVDSLYAAAGKQMRTEELTFDPDGRRPGDAMISLGRPSRAWMLTSLSNERDRPSLALPRAQVVVDVLEAFGWSGSRQNPRTDRETDPNVLQPGVLANSILSTWITRASSGSGLAELAVQAPSPEALVDSVFLRFLSRKPTAAERAQFSKALSEGFDTRLVSPGAIETPAPPKRLPRVSWSNHLSPESTTIKLEMETRARAGDPPDGRLTPAWRETYEDFVWAVINSPEFVWMP